MSSKLQEEAEAIASEYQRRADEAWLDELSVKAAIAAEGTTKTAIANHDRHAAAMANRGSLRS